MKSLKNFIKEDHSWPVRPDYMRNPENMRIPSYIRSNAKNLKYYQECYFDWNGDRDAEFSLRSALRQVNDLQKGRAVGGIDDYDDTILFSIAGRSEKDVKEYGNTLLMTIDKQYKNMVDCFSGDIEECD